MFKNCDSYGIQYDFKNELRYTEQRLTHQIEKIEQRLTHLTEKFEQRLTHLIEKTEWRLSDQFEKALSNHRENIETRIEVVPPVYLRLFRKLTPRGSRMNVQIQRPYKPS
jgi:hypothetical protein